MTLEQGELGERKWFPKKKGNSMEAWLPSACPQEDPAAPLHHQRGSLDAITQFISKTSEQFPLPWSTY